MSKIQNENPRSQRKKYYQKSQHRAKTMNKIKLNGSHNPLRLLLHCTSNWTISLNPVQVHSKEAWVRGSLLCSHQPNSLIFHLSLWMKLWNTLEWEERNLGDCIFLRSWSYVNDLNACLMLYLSCSSDKILRAVSGKADQWF